MQDNNDEQHRGRPLVEEREISLIELWYAVKKHLLLILILGTVLGAATFAINSFVLQPEYQAQSTLIVGKPQGYQDTTGQGLTINDVNLNQKLVGTYAEIMKSETVMSQVNDNLGLSTSVRELSQKIRVSTVNNTEIISLSVVDTVPERAMDIANETTIIFMDEVQSIMKVDNVQILDGAKMPDQPIRPRVLINTAIGIILGLALGFFIAIVRELINTKVKSPEDYKNSFGIPVIGVIPDSK